MSTNVHFLVPDFDKSIKDKVNDLIEVVCPTVLKTVDSEHHYRPAIATNGFSSQVDGIYMFALKFLQAKNGIMTVGFSNTKTFDSSQGACFPDNKITGVGFHPYLARAVHELRYLPLRISAKAKEVISVLIISNNGCKKEVQWIVDGVEGRIIDCTRFLTSGDEIFPCVSLCRNGQQIAFVPFEQLTSRSPKIDELMREYGIGPKNPEQESSTSVVATAGQQKESGRRRQRVEENEENATQTNTKAKKK